MFKLCDDIDTMAMVMLDGELAEQELRDMELHLLACGACKTHVERERAAHLLRRQRLAAPPAPALVRARIGRALDEIDRARRPALRAYLLPVGAALAAVAALVVFVAAPGKPAAKTDKPIATTAGAPEEPFKKITAGGLADHREWTEADLQFQRSGSQFLGKGKESALLYYAVLTPEGEQLSLEAIVTDAEPLNLDPAAARTIGGYAVWLDTASGLVVVRDGARAIILSSHSISQAGLVRIVDRSLLILRIGTDDPRRCAGRPTC